MVELIKRAVYLTDENLPTLAAQRPSAYGDEWLKPGAWGCRSEGSSDTRCAEVFTLPERAGHALSPFRRFAHSPHPAPYRSLRRALATAACQPA
jgi:hypothetical protein